VECSKCHRVWHVGGPQCPSCGAYAIGELPPPDPEVAERQPSGISLWQFILGSLFASMVTAGAIYALFAVLRGS